MGFLPVLTVRARRWTPAYWALPAHLRAPRSGLHDTGRMLLCQPSFFLLVAARVYAAVSRRMPRRQVPFRLARSTAPYTCAQYRKHRPLRPETVLDTNRPDAAEGKASLASALPRAAGGQSMGFHRSSSPSFAAFRISLSSPGDRSPLHRAAAPSARARRPAPRRRSNRSARQSLRRHVPPALP